MAAPFFSFDESYLNAVDSPTLSQSFFQSTGEIIPEIKASSGKLPPFFSNLLPEGHMRTYLAQRGSIKPSNEFKLIETLGKDLSGAVIISELESTADKVRLEPARPENKKSQPLRFSLAGTQLKFSAVAEKHGGLTIPANGMDGNWIVKLPAQNYQHVPENEFAIMHLASQIGIAVPEIKLIPLSDIANLPDMGILKGKKALAVKRFDRSSSVENNPVQRIHIEDFAQVYNVAPEKKYQGVSYANIAAMIWNLLGETGLIDFIRRLTFCILTGNGDMHLKNWSLIYKDGKTPTLAPAYDLLSTVPYIPDDQLALTLSETKNMKIINTTHFKKLANKIGAPEFLVLQTVRETVELTLNAWDMNKKHYEVADEIKSCIQGWLDGVGIRKG